MSKLSRAPLRSGSHIATLLCGQTPQQPRTRSLKGQRPASIRRRGNGPLAGPGRLPAREKPGRCPAPQHAPSSPSPQDLQANPSSRDPLLRFGRNRNCSPHWIPWSHPCRIFFLFSLRARPHDQVRPSATNSVPTVAPPLRSTSQRIPLPGEQTVSASQKGHFPPGKRPARPEAHASEPRGWRWVGPSLPALAARPSRGSLAVFPSPAGVI